MPQMCNVDFIDL